MTEPTATQTAAARLMNTGQPQLAAVLAALTDDAPWADALAGAAQAPSWRLQVGPQRIQLRDGAGRTTFYRAQPTVRSAAEAWERLVARDLVPLAWGAGDKRVRVFGGGVVYAAYDRGNVAPGLFPPRRGRHPRPSNLHDVVAVAANVPAIVQAEALAAALLGHSVAFDWRVVSGWQARQTALLLASDGGTMGGLVRTRSVAPDRVLDAQLAAATWRWGPTWVQRDGGPLRAPDPVDPADFDAARALLDTGCAVARHGDQTAEMWLPAPAGRRGAHISIYPGRLQ